MDTSDSPPRTSSDETARKAQHYLSLSLLVACPILIALPPRKLDKYTIFLSGAFVLSASHLTVERTGRGILSNLTSSLGGDAPPTARAELVKERLRFEKLEQLHREGRDAEPKNKTIIERVWLGKEDEEWKEKRRREEQEAIDEGKGYGRLIMDQLYEVWNGEKKKDHTEEDDSDSMSAGNAEK